MCRLISIQANIHSFQKAISFHHVRDDDKIKTQWESRKCEHIEGRMCNDGQKFNTAGRRGAYPSSRQQDIGKGNH